MSVVVDFGRSLYACEWADGSPVKYRGLVVIAPEKVWDALLPGHRVFETTGDTVVCRGYRFNEVLQAYFPRFRLQDGSYVDVPFSPETFESQG